MENDEFCGKDMYVSNDSLKMLAYLVVKQWCEDGHPSPVPYEFIDVLVSVSHYPADIYDRWKNGQRVHADTDTVTCN